VPGHAGSVASSTMGMFSHGGAAAYDSSASALWPPSLSVGGRGRVRRQDGARVGRPTYCASAPRAELWPGTGTNAGGSEHTAAAGGPPASAVRRSEDSAARWVVAPRENMEAQTNGVEKTKEK
jgi:hypothetical protein